VRASKILGMGAARVPLKLMLAVVALSLALSEWFPFSYFPMYAKLSKSSWYVYVTDLQDRPLALETDFGMRAARVKRIFRTLRDEEGGGSRTPEVEAIAGRRVLQIVLDQGLRKPDPMPQGLRLWKVRIEERDGVLERIGRPVAELSPL
jgi:hypothetical protein